jgi:hypothetical protein
VLDRITVGRSVWETFVVDQYLQPGGYVADGYSQMKLVIGRPGAGKTHLLRRLTEHALGLGYIAVLLSATNLRLQHVDSLYAAIAAQVDLEELASRLAHRAVAELGYDLADVPAKTTFLSWAIQERDRIDIRLKRDVEEVLGRFFKRERVDPNFSLAFTQIASDILGTNPLSPQDRGNLLRWLRGEKLRAEELHRIHLARGIDRYNARDMLHSLADFVRQQGHTGLFVAIDQMEDLPLGRDAQSGRLKYPKGDLADAYQGFREMIDNLPSMPGMMIILAGRPDFLELPRGIKSYDALWLRIQHEIVSPWFNQFAQVLDLDRAVQAKLTPVDVQSLYQSLIALSIKTRPFVELPVQDILSMNAGDGVYRRLMQQMLAERAAGG